jgi:hypothetical protein
MLFLKRHETRCEWCELRGNARMPAMRDAETLKCE